MTENIYKTADNETPGALLAQKKAREKGMTLAQLDLLNDRMVPFFEEYDVKLLRVLTDRGSEYCGISERHEYEL
jgi:hypothetical protein